MNAAVAAQAVVKQVEREKHQTDGNTAILEVLDDIDKVLQQKPRLLWSPSEFDEMFQTVDAVRETIEKLDDAQFGAAHSWFSPLLRHVSKLSRSAVHMLLLFEEQQDKWYFRPAALAREAGRLDELLQDAMGVVANATQGVPPSPQAALHTPEARTFWKDRIDPEGSCFELEIARFQAAVVEELDPDGGWTEQQKAQYLEVMAGELDKHNLGLVSVYDFSEFTAEKGLRVSCMQLFLRLILTFGSRKMEAVRKQAKRRQQQAELRAGHGDGERVIEWMNGEGFSPETAGVLLKNDLELGDLWRLRDSDFKQMGIQSMGVRRKLLGAARRLRSLYLKPAPGGFSEWMESQVHFLCRVPRPRPSAPPPAAFAATMHRRLLTQPTFAAGAAFLPVSRACVCVCCRHTGSRGLHGSLRAAQGRLRRVERDDPRHSQRDGDTLRRPRPGLARRRVAEGGAVLRGGH